MVLLCKLNAFTLHSDKSYIEIKGQFSPKRQFLGQKLSTIEYQIQNKLT